MTNGDDVIEQWCRAGEDGDAAAAARCLAPDVELISPLTEGFRFSGRAEVRTLLEEALAVIQDLSFHTRVGAGDTRALFYSGRIGTQSLEEAQLVRLDGSGAIRHLTLFARPLPAATALMGLLGPRLARRYRRRPLAAVLAAASLPLHAMARFGERRLVPLAAPGAARSLRPGRR